MKTQGFFVMLAALLLVSCAPIEIESGQLSGNLVNYIVEFTAGSGSSELTVHTGPQRCPGGKNGCVGFEIGELGTIKFQFRGNQKNRNCSTSPQALWVITKVQLSATGDPSTEKGVFGGAQPAWLVDAFPGVNETNGLLYESTNVAATKSVTFIDLNSNLIPQDIYYQVTASKCDLVNPDEIEIDPKIRNSGK